MTTRCCLSILVCSIFVANAQTPPAPLGKLVDAGGYRVHLFCTGEGSPTVLVVGGFSMDWALVQPDVAKFTRVCTYDVAGTAWSDAAPVGTCKQRITEMHNLRLPSPFILAGFSVGGLVARYYASQYPDDVAGMVLIDHAFTPTPIPADPKTKEESGGVTRPVLIFQTPITFTVEETSDFEKLPERMQELHRWAAARKPEVDHSIAADDCELQVGKKSLGATRLAVVSTGNQARGYSELQARLLSLSTRSEQFKAERSFHSVEIDQPEVVVEAIKRLVNQVRQAR